MKAHRYRVGQTLHFRPARGIEGRPGDVRIERLLPAESGANQYRVESVFDGLRRVVREDELSPRAAAGLPA